MVQVKLVKAFSANGSGGNMAGVVLGAEAFTTEQMQSIAKEVSYSETAFVRQGDDADFDIRFFTPNSEVELCGHATIGAFSVMAQTAAIQSGRYTQKTKAGVLQVEVKSDGTIIMEQTEPKFFEKIDQEEILRSLGLSLTSLEETLHIQIVSTGLRDIIIPLRSRNHLAGIKPDFKRIKDICKKYDVVGYHVFTLDTEAPYTAACRNFAPLYDIPEEAATGTSSGALGAYLWTNQTVNKEVMKFIQGVEMGSASDIDVILETGNGVIEKVWVGGKAYIAGEKNIEL